MLGGRVRAVIAGRELRCGAGEVFVVPAGTPHRMASDGPARVHWEVRPAVRTAEFLEAVHGGEGGEDLLERSPSFASRTEDLPYYVAMAVCRRAGAVRCAFFAMLVLAALAASAAATAGANAPADTTAPRSWASAQATSRSISWRIRFKASDTGSGVASVDVYAVPPGGTASVVFSDTSGAASGSFVYTASAGDGAYGFYTVATDAAGNVEPVPSAPDTATVLDTVAPTSSVSAPTRSTAPDWTVTSAANDAGSGVAHVELWVRVPGTSAFALEDTSEDGTFAYNATAGGGNYAFLTIAVDRAGNRQPRSSAPRAVVRFRPAGYTTNAPAVILGVATDVRSRGAKLTGAVNPNRGAAQYRFEYGTSRSYGSVTPPVDLLPDHKAVGVSAPITGLKPGRTYHFRLVATNMAGTSVSPDASFRTLPPKPRRVTLSAKPGRDRSSLLPFRLSGRVARPAGVGRRACRGVVMLQITRGAKTVAHRTAKLRRGCRYSATVGVTGSGRGKLEARAQFLGNRRLGPLRSRAVTLRRSR